MHVEVSHTWCFSLHLWTQFVFFLVSSRSGLSVWQNQECICCYSWPYPVDFGQLQHWLAVGLGVGRLHALDLGEFHVLRKFAQKILASFAGSDIWRGLTWNLWSIIVVGIYPSFCRAQLWYFRRQKYHQRYFLLPVGLKVEFGGHVEQSLLRHLCRSSNVCNGKTVLNVVIYRLRSSRTSWW